MPKTLDYWRNDLRSWSKLEPGFCREAPGAELGFEVCIGSKWFDATAAYVQHVVLRSIRTRGGTFCDLTIDPLEAKAVIYNANWYLCQKDEDRPREAAFRGLCISPEPPVALLSAYVSYLLDLLDMRGKL